MADQDDVDGSLAPPERRLAQDDEADDVGEESGDADGGQEEAVNDELELDGHLSLGFRVVEAVDEGLVGVVVHGD